MFILHGDKRSGNCQKVAFVATHLGLPFRWQDVDVMSGATRTQEFLARNPAGQVPVVEFEDGRHLAQSNAIMLYLAEDSALVPADSWHRARMFEWLFWEQYSHETSIAVVRFQRHFLGWDDDRVDADRVTKGNAALDLMDKHLAERHWLVADALSLADLALVAYTRWAGEGGFDLAGRPAVVDWVTRVERAVPIVD